MDLIHLLLILVAIGFGLYIIKRFIPMDSNISQIITIIVVVAVIIWLLKVFGIFDISSVHIGK